MKVKIVSLFILVIATLFVGQSQALQNGEPPNGQGGSGAVVIQIWNNERWNQLCSGQVVARDSILTASNCFRFFDRPAGNRWFYVIWRQDVSGLWTNLTQNLSNNGWMQGEFKLHPDYDGVQVTAPTVTDNGWRNHDTKNDVAVLTLDDNLVGVSQEDSTYLDNDIVNRGRPGQFLGYGTGRLRQGRYEVLWDNPEQIYTSTPITTDPRICPGDFGGPLKDRNTVTERNGIQIGVASQVTGGCLAGGSQTDFAAIQPNVSFITGALPGRCFNATNLAAVGRVTVKWCW